MSSRRVYLSKLFAGDLSPFGGPSPDQSVAGQIRSEQMKGVLRSAPGMMLAVCANAAVLAIALWSNEDRWYGLAWAIVVISAALHSRRKAVVSLKRAQPLQVSRGAIYGLVKNAAFLGCAWGIIPVIFFDQASHGVQLVITCLCAGMLAGGAFAFATIPIAAITFALPVLLGSVASIGRSGDYVYLLVAILTVVYACVLLRIVLSNSFEFSRRLIAQIEAQRAVREDSLTRLPNRVAFNEKLDSCIEDLHQKRGSFVLLMLDLHHFKEVNDKYGHPAGDDYLIQLATRLRRCARRNETIARLGGDEFGIIGEGIKDPSQALELATRVQSIFVDPFWLEGHSIVGGAGVGVAIAPSDGDTATDLLKRADSALYRAKRKGPGSICFHDTQDDATARERQVMIHDLGLAIKNNQMFLLYQPFFDFKSRSISGFEVLIRWQHPRLGLIPPLDFIPLAEETGHIHLIGKWVLEKACETLAQLPSDVRIAVNVSAVQLQNVSLLNTVVQALSSNKLQAGRLELELTESTLISNYDALSGLLNSLLALGVTIALDDFGTGYSSLTHLRKFPFDRIKIDRSFTGEMLLEKGSAAIVKAVVQLASVLGMKVIAEGIETIEQFQYLSDIGAHEGQGYFIGKPVTFDKALQLTALDPHLEAFQYKGHLEK